MEINNTPDTASRTAKMKDSKRVIRPRSKVACRHCRLRKVRCDVYPTGAPCTNCRLDDIDCTLCEKRRYPKRNTHHANRPDIRGSSSSHHLDNTRDSCQADEDASRHSPTKNTEEDGEPEGSTVHASSLRTMEDFPIGNDQQPFTLTMGTFVPFGTGRESPSSSSYVETLPSYLHCDLSHLSNENLSHLAANGCFTLPIKSVVDDLLKYYFDFIHPQLPVLDEQEFWERYLAQRRECIHFDPIDSETINLLLFQAVIFAATTCVSLSVLQKAGYSSRKLARRAAFSKVHALYSLNVEQNKIVVLQSLLLMSYWRDDSDDYEDAWHWSGQAVAIAYSLRLQSNPNTSMSERQKAIWKRCWWSCVLRDRLVALSEQRSQRIRLEECDTPMLTLADYNVGLRSQMGELSPGEELGKRTALSLFSIQLIRLVLCIGNNSCNKDEDASSPAASETWTRTKLINSEDSFRTGIENLDYWRLNLPEVLQHPPERVGDDAVLPCILVHRNALHIYYHKAILSICTSRLLSSMSACEPNLDSELLHQSSLNLSKLYDELVDCDLIHCLPSDCLGSPTQIGSTKMDKMYLAKIFTSILGRPRDLCVDITGATPVSKLDISGPTTTGNLAQYSLESVQIEGSSNETNIDEPNQILGEQDLNDLGLKNMPDYVSDGSWIFDDNESSGATSSNFPDLSADGSSIITSEVDVDAVESSTLLNLEALLSASSEVVKCP